jgi:SAM-dependent methyltransferase
MSRASLTAAYFEDLYAADPDPWRFASSDYERDKYARTLQALRRKSYGSALEIGCSVGVLTRQLSEYCDNLLAIDIAAAPLEAAKARCRDRPNVQFARMAIPGAWPDGLFDLILLSEVVYYLDTGDVGRLADRLATSLPPDGEALLVHWTGPTNYPLSGDEAAELLLRNMDGFSEIVQQERTEKFRLDLVARR